MVRYIKLILGSLFIITSIVFALLSFTNVTGYAIIDDIGKPTSSIITIVLFVIGLMVMAEARQEKGELEKTLDVEVYKARVDKKNLVPARDYFIVDKKSALGKQVMSLGEFTRAYNQISNDSELVGLVRDEYSESLLALHSDRGEHAEVADAFLKVLGIKPNNRETDAGYKIPKEYREELKIAFRQYDGTIDKRQKEILNKLGVDIVHGKKHYLFKLRESGEMVKAIPSTPSDIRGGLNAVSQLVNSIEKARNRKRN